MLTERFDHAVSYARKLHEGHKRKGTEIPYFMHLLQVSGLVLEYGGDEDEAIAGLLHDGPEDRGGEPVLQEIERRFGARVAEIVRENSDSMSEDPDDKDDWQSRKETYLAAIPHKTVSACLVSICDKIHNARSLISDQIELGDPHWSRFKRGRVESLWYYRSLVEAFSKRAGDDPRLPRPWNELSRTVAQLENA